MLLVLPVSFLCGALFSALVIAVFLIVEQSLKI